MRAGADAPAALEEEFHDMRHTRVAFLIVQRQQQYQMMEHLGQKSLNTTSTRTATCSRASTRTSERPWKPPGTAASRWRSKSSCVPTSPLRAAREGCLAHPLPPALSWSGWGDLNSRPLDPGRALGVLEGVAKCQKVPLTCTFAISR